MEDQNVEEIAEILAELAKPMQEFDNQSLRRLYRTGQIGENSPLGLKYRMLIVELDKLTGRHNY